MILFNIICNPLRIWFELLGPIKQFLAYVYYYGYVLSYYICIFTVIETLILRLLIVWIWKRPPPLCDDFFQVFVRVFNIMLALLQGSQQFFTKEGGFLVYKYEFTDFENTELIFNSFFQIDWKSRPVSKGGDKAPHWTYNCCRSIDVPAVNISSFCCLQS